MDAQIKLRVDQIQEYMAKKKEEKTKWHKDPSKMDNGKKKNIFSFQIQYILVTFYHEKLKTKYNYV